MEKSPEAFRTISEVAELLDTPAHVLRFWESRFPQIRPVKRAGGRRYYRPGDVALLSGIKRLLHDDGMTIRGVQKILREHGVRHVAGLIGAEPSDPAADDIDAVLAAEFGPEAPEARPEPTVAQTAQIISLERALARGEATPTQEALPAAEPPQEEAADAPFWSEEEEETPTDEPAAAEEPPEAPIQQDVAEAPEETRAETAPAEAAVQTDAEVMLAPLLRRLPASALRDRRIELTAIHTRLSDLRERLAQASRRRGR